jgi:tetratricopeptide (TPR) repeat protein
MGRNKGTAALDFSAHCVVSLVLMRKLIILIIMALLPLPILAEDKSSSITNFLQGYRSEMLGKYDEAMERYKSALRLDPDSAELRAEIALLFM